MTFENIERHPISDYLDLELWIIDSEFAREILATSTTTNRRLRTKGVKAFSKEMKAGRWRVRDPIRFEKGTKNLLDGHHRLRAVIDCDIPQPFLVQLDAERKDMEIFDQNIKRTPGDHLFITGAVSHDNVMVGILRGAIGYERLPNRVWNSVELFIRDYAERYNRNPGDPDLFEMVRREGIDCYHDFPVMRATDYGFTLFQLQDFGVPFNEARDFLRLITKPIGLPSDHPIVAYNRWLAEYNIPVHRGDGHARQRIYNNNIKVFNQVKKGVSVKRFRRVDLLTPSEKPIV